MGGNDARRQQRGVGGAVDADGGHGHSGRHHRRGKQRVHAEQRARFDGDPDHGQRRLRRHGAGKGRGKSGHGDDRFQAARARVLGVMRRVFRRAVSRSDGDLERDAELAQRGADFLGVRRVAGGAEDDADFGIAHLSSPWEEFFAKTW